MLPLPQTKSRSLINQLGESILVDIRQRLNSFLAANSEILCTQLDLCWPLGPTFPWDDLVHRREISGTIWHAKVENDEINAGPVSLPLSFISLNADISGVFDQIDREPLILTPSSGSPPPTYVAWPRNDAEDNIEGSRLDDEESTIVVNPRFRRHSRDEKFNVPIGLETNFMLARSNYIRFECHFFPIKLKFQISTHFSALESIANPNT